MSDQWFVHSNGEQMGPYTGEQLVQFGQEGSVTAETMVWAEGMPEWAPASEIPGLLPEAAAPAAAQPAAAAWAPPGSRLATGGASALGGSKLAGATSLTPQAVGGEYPYIPIKSASFGLWLWTFVGGFIFLLISIIMMITGAVSAGVSLAQASAANYAENAQTAETVGEADTAGDNTETVETPIVEDTAPITETVDTEGASGFAGLGMGMVLFVIAWISMMLSSIFFLMNLYRAWSCLQAGGPRTTPGKAIGFMFIPFFNIYWLFVVINGLPKDWNRIVSSYDDLKPAPRLNETTFLLYCIGVFIAPLAIVMIFPMMSQICKGINFFAARKNPNAPSTFSAFGGR